YAVGKHWSKRIYESLLRSRDPKAYYSHLLKAATNYEQWAEAAAILDSLQGKDKWKNDPKSSHYDYEMLQERLSQLAKARESGDLGLMIFLLRTSLSRNLGNVGRPQLYAETIIGTKRLIEDYNSEVIRQLNIICDTESDDFSLAAKLEFFTHTRQAFGRTALLLSGGATMGLMHIGVIKTLYESQLLPRIISGSSCGSIIAAILCTRTDEELPSILQFDKFNFTVFHTVEEQGDVLARIMHFLKNGALFDAQVLKAALKDNIGDVTFQEAYNRTRRILNVTVSTSATFEMPRLLNYLTAPNVYIWSAVATSCAAPFIYNSAPLMAKDKNGEEVHWNPSRYHWIDGSVENDLPMNKLSELFNVNHFIVCQVNPYIVPFLHNSLARSPTNRVLGWMLYQARSELQHRMNQLSILGVMPELIHKVQAIMSQRYYGDITIVPDLGVDDYLNIVSNPTVEFLVDATLKGERATWPKISIIKNHCSIEHCLDDILYRLRLRRLEAYRAYPQAQSGSQSKMPSETNSQYNRTHAQSTTYLNPHSPSTQRRRTVSPNTSTTTLPNTGATGGLGRSKSSPASPATDITLGLSQPDLPNSSNASEITTALTTTTPTTMPNTPRTAEPSSMIEQELAAEDSNGNKENGNGGIEAYQVNYAEPLDITTLSSTEAISAAVTPSVEINALLFRSGTSSHSRPQSLRHAESSSDQSAQSPMGSPLTMHSQNRLRSLDSNHSKSKSSDGSGLNSTPTSLTTTFKKQLPGEGDDAEEHVQRLQHHGSDTTGTVSTSSRRSSSSSMSSIPSATSFVVGSGGDSLTTKDASATSTSATMDNTGVAAGPGATLSNLNVNSSELSSSSSGLLIMTNHVGSAPTTPVPVVVHTNTISRANRSSQSSSSSSKTKITTKTKQNAGSGGNSNNVNGGAGSSTETSLSSGGSRIKHHRTFHMTKVRNT
ncbi:hypothetical protein BGZ99_002481, partial [Dissophora globulifera]